MERAYEALTIAKRVIGGVTFEGEEVFSLGRLDAIYQMRRPPSEDDFQAAFDNLRQREMARATPTPATMEMEYRAARATLKSRLAALEAAERDSDYDKAEEIWRETLETESDAERELFEAAPTTDKGALALLRAIADHVDEYEVNNTITRDLIGESIRSAVAVLECGEA